MKKIFLLIVLLAGCCMSNFAQFNNRLLLDTTLNNQAFKKNLRRISATDSLCFKRIYKDSAMVSISKIARPELSNKDLALKLQETNNIHRKRELLKYDNMPIARPQAPFTMPICVPDSTVKHTILIKKD